MSFFLFVNAATVVVSAYLILRVLFLSRDTLVRPSFMLGFFLFLFVQCGSAWIGREVFEKLSQPWHYYIATQLLPVFALLYASFVGRGWGIMLPAEINVAQEHGAPKLMHWAVFFCAFEYWALYLYLREVPFEHTAIWAIIGGERNADQVRESTFKELNSWGLLYVFTLAEKVVAPIVVALGTASLLAGLRAGRKIYTWGALLIIIMAVLPLVVYGARGPITQALMVGAFMVSYVLVMRGTRRVLLFACLLPVMVLVPAILMTMLKNNELGLQGAYFHGVNIFERLVVRGNYDNMWHLQYVERYGIHGVAAIPKLASLLGVQSVDILNLVGREFSPAYSKIFISSVSASASYSIINYAILGWWGHALSFLMVPMLDLLLFLYRRIEGRFILPLMSAMLVPVSSLSFSMMTTVFLSKGLLLIPLLFLGVSWLDQATRMGRSR